MATIWTVAIRAVLLVCGVGVIPSDAKGDQVSTNRRGRPMRGAEWTRYSQQIPAADLTAYAARRPSEGQPRACSNLTYDSRAFGSVYLSGTGPSDIVEFLDDIELAGGRSICSVAVVMYGGTGVTVPYTVTCNLYANAANPADSCPSNGAGRSGPGTLLATSNATVTAAGLQTATFNFPTGPTVPDARPNGAVCDPAGVPTPDFWLGIFVNGTIPNDRAGPVIRACAPEVPELGCSRDSFGVLHNPIIADDACDYYLGGCSDPDQPAMATFAATIRSDVVGDMGFCCDLLTGACGQSLPENCLGQLQQFSFGSCPSCQACAAVPPVGTSENEPVCTDAYRDVTNGGCTSVPPVFGVIALGQTLNGTSGTYLVGGQPARDNDWFRLRLAAAAIGVSLRVQAEFNFYAAIVRDPSGDSNCVDPLESLVEVRGGPCDSPSSSGIDLAPGEYYVMIRPDRFGGVDCGRRWKMTLGCGCPGDFRVNRLIDQADIPGFVAALLTQSACADVNDNGVSDGVDVSDFVAKVLANGGTGTPCAP